MSCGVPKFNAVALHNRGLFNNRDWCMRQTCLYRNIREVMGGRRCRHAAPSPAIRAGIYSQPFELYRLCGWQAALRSSLATSTAWNDVSDPSFVCNISQNAAVLFSRIRPAIYCLSMDVVSVQLWENKVVLIKFEVVKKQL